MIFVGIALLISDLGLRISSGNGWAVWETVEKGLEQRRRGAKLVIRFRTFVSWRLCARTYMFFQYAARRLLKNPDYGNGV